MTDTYILQGHVAVPEPDIRKWGVWFENGMEARRVAETTVGDVRVSTVFLGLDHGFGSGAPPLLFETMVFGGSLDEEMTRYETWEQAEAGHIEMVERVTEVEQQETRR